MKKRSFLNSGAWTYSNVLVCQSARLIGICIFAITDDAI